MAKKSDIFISSKDLGNLIKNLGGIAQAANHLKLSYSCVHNKFCNGLPIFNDTIRRSKLINKKLELKKENKNSYIFDKYDINLLNEYNKVDASLIKSLLICIKELEIFEKNEFDKYENTFTKILELLFSSECDTDIISVTLPQLKYTLLNYLLEYINKF